MTAQFRELFGTVWGNKVQAWCNKWGWSLVWTLGPSYPDVNKPPTGIGANQNRLVDPTAKGKGLNATAAHGVSAAWDMLWSKAVQARSGGGGGSSTPSDGTIDGWWAEAKVAVGRGMVVQPIRAGVCANPDQCIGLTYDTQECLCYHVHAESSKDN